MKSRSLALTLVLAVAATSFAALPFRSPHFIVEGGNAEVRCQLLEKVYSAFIDVSGLLTFDLKEPIQVVIYADRQEYQRARNLRRLERQSREEEDDEEKGRKLNPEERTRIFTYEQSRIDGLLAEMAATRLVDAFLKRKDDDLEWVRRGLISTVVAEASSTGLEEQRDRWRQILLKDQPLAPRAVRRLEKKAETAAIAERERLEKMTEAQQKQFLERRTRITEASLTAFLIDRFGRLSFTVFIQKLADGLPVDEALARAYPGKIRSLTELYGIWKDDDLS